MNSTKKKKEPSTRSLCWCKEKESYPHPKHPEKRKLRPHSEIVDDLLSLRDGQDDALGALLLRAANEIKRLAKDKEAPKSDLIVVARMESESKSWLAVGRTEEEAKEALKQAWNKDVVAAGGQSWDKFGECNDPWEWYSGFFQHVKLGHGYVDGWDERS